MTNSIPPAHHHPIGGFRNPWPAQPLRGLGGMLRWTFERARRGQFGFARRGTPPTLARPAIPVPRTDRDECRVTWVGHSTFLLQVGGLNVLTDPIWGDRASPVRWAGPRRLVPPGLPFDALPPIDLVLQSHDHYDHLCDATVRAIADRHPSAHWLAPLGVGAQLRERGVRIVTERDWHGSVTIGDATATCVPAQHFSGRSLTDRNHSLWGGWVLGTGRHRIYFAGDSGHHPDFADIGRRHGPFDVVLMPIGAYDPRWFMQPVHVNPEEAVDAFAAAADPSTAVMVAMHWGTFALTDEPVDEPPVRARAAWRARGFVDERLWIMAPGETRALAAVSPSHANRDSSQSAASRSSTSCP